MKNTLTLVTQENQHLFSAQAQSEVSPQNQMQEIQMALEAHPSNCVVVFGDRKFWQKKDRCVHQMVGYIPNPVMVSLPDVA